MTFCLRGRYHLLLRLLLHQFFMLLLHWPY